MRRSVIIVHIYAILSMFFWGYSYIWAKIVFRYYSPLTTVFLRLVISSAILFASILIMKKAQRVEKRDIGLFLASSFLTPFLYFLGESYGLNLVSPTISSVIIATIPLFTPLVAFFVIKEKLPLINIIGIMVSFFGIIVMLLDRDLTFRASLTGVALLFGAVASAIFYTLLLRKLTLKYSPLCVITYQNLIGIFYFLPFFLIFHWDNFLSVQLNFELISSMLQLAVFASSLAYIFYTIAIKHLGVSRANVYTNLIPIFTAAISWLVLKEMFDINKILGMTIVICGVFLTQIRNMRRIKFFKW